MKQHTARWSLTLSLLLIVSTLSFACRFGPRMDPAERTATPQAGEPTPTPVPLPPQVIQVTPEPGAELPLDAPLQFMFDQTMDPDSVEAAFAIEPAVPGAFEWPSDRVLLFRPRGAGFERATRYTITIGEDARSQRDLAMKTPASFRFTTVGFLEVATVQPAPDAVDVAPDARVTVLFNRPVVPLSAIEDQDNLPQPLTFVPSVAGEGEWLNTSIYAFTPEEGFAPATTYKARVAAGLEDTTGGVLAEDFVWQFTTITPKVSATYPAPDTIYVSREPTIHVAFNQAMDHASAEEAFALKHLQSGQVLSGTFEWHDAGLVQPRRSEVYQPYQWSWSRGTGPERVGAETMSFTPDRPLDFGTTYVASVGAGAQAANGASGTEMPYNWIFDTIPTPAIVNTSPADGESAARPWGGLEISFSGPMNPASINDNFSIRPTVAATDVYTYWWDSDTKLEISFPIEPNTDYAVTLSGDIESRYGDPLGADRTIRWRTRALDPIVDLYAPYRVGTYNAYTETQAYVTARNVRRVNFALYRMPLADFLRANGEDSWEFWNDYRGEAEQLLREWSLDVAPPLNESRIYPASLAGPEGGTLDPGIYYLEVSAALEDIYPEAAYDPPVLRERQILVLSRANLTLKTGPSEALIWATDLQSGAELAGLPVVVMDEDRQVLAQGTTDGDGLFASESYTPTDRWTPIFALTGDPEAPGADFAVAANQWDEGISPWRFDLPVDSSPNSFAGYFFTERPIYRPGQTVYFKGILRRDDDAHYSLPGADTASLCTIGSSDCAESLTTEMLAVAKTVHVVVLDPQGTKVFEDDLTLNDMGTLHSELTLDAEAALGTYVIEAAYQDEYFSASFRVAEYRKPEFQVTVETDESEYVHGDEINVSAEATYFFGGPVADAEVRYTVLATDHYFDYQGPGWWDFVDYNYSRGRGISAYGERVAEGEGTTDAEGRFTFAVEADIAEYLTSQRFTLEVAVTDVNNQEVSNRTEALVHKGLYYIGLRPTQYVGQVGEETAVDLITVDWQSEPAPERALTVVFAEHNWYSVQKQAEDGRYYWEGAYEDVPVYTTTVETDAQGEAQVAFTPEKGGIYKVIATGLDARENEVRSSTLFWVSGRDYVSWRQENNDRLELVADKPEYQVGETATILVPHPYQGPVQALVTIERGHIYRHWVQTLETNSEQLEIPITEDLIPNVFVSVVIVKGQDETAPLASFKVGYVQLPIRTTEKELTITLTPDQAADEHYRPGERVSYAVRASDSAGDPVEAELALSLVDLSVLTLADERGPGIVDYFWRERGLSINTATGLTLSGDRVNETVASEVKGLGGGGGAEEFGAVRKNFQDTAYWNPTLRTDAQGEAQVSVELPDNLTTWRMSARGITADTLVGQAQVDVVSTKDLLVRPVAPRFFVVGDEAELAAVVHNNTDAEIDVEIELAAQGLRLDDPQAQSAAIPAGGNVKVTWDVTVEDVAETVLTFSARTRGLTARWRTHGAAAPAAQLLSDAVEITLPVYRYSTPEVVATAGELAQDGERLEAVVLPPSVDPTQGELTLELDPSLAAGMTDGLDYLTHFPYECTEQTVSRFLPNVVTYRAYRELGLDRPDLEAALPEVVGVGLQRLYNQQHADGGWGWWSQDRSDPFISAYVLLGMVEAERAGFVVDEAAMEQAVEYLREGGFSIARDVTSSWQANRQAFVLYVLAEAGADEFSRAVRLFTQREQLDTFGKAYLALALDLWAPDEPTRVDALLSDITGEAIVSATGAHWEEAQPDYYAMNTDTRSTAIVLAALARLDPEHALASNAVRWLMTNREAGRWETTQETAWAIIALTDWMVHTGELEGAYDWRVALNGETLDEGAVTPATVDEATQLQVAVADLLADEANRVLIQRQAPADEDEGSGRLYYGLYLRTFKPAEAVTALNRGIIVSRRYSRADCDPEAGPCPAIDGAQVGDVIRVKLTLIAPNDLHYVVVEDPLPAGAEAVDLSLNTTSVTGQAPELTRTDRSTPWGGGYGWWWFSQAELRDEKAVLFASFLPQGTYEYTYLIRASLPGEYRVIPTHAEEMYFPEVFGRGDGGLFTISE